MDDFVWEVAALHLALLGFLIEKFCTKTRGMWSATLRENWQGHRRQNVLRHLWFWLSKFWCLPNGP